MMSSHVARGRWNLAANTVLLMRRIGMKAFQTVLLPSVAPDKIKRLNSDDDQSASLRSLDVDAEIDRALSIAIAPFRSSKNNDVRNGLLLCKNAHWLFDVGLWSLDADYRVIVADSAFDADSPDQTPLQQMVGRRVRLPREERHWPLITNLAAHRKLHGF